MLTKGLVILQELWGHVFAGHIADRELSGRMKAGMKQHSTGRPG